jgi:Zn-dependent protease
MSAPGEEIGLAALHGYIHNHQRQDRRRFEDPRVNPMAPAPTALDLHWRLFGIDFRVQPMFWIINLVFGYFYVQNLRGWDDHKLAYLGIWLACAFVSILIHELGHVTAGRIFGQRSNIILHGMGGVAIGSFDRLTRWQRIVVSAAGPAAGFMLFALAEWGLKPLVNGFNHSWYESRWYSVIANPINLPFFHEGEQIQMPGVLVVMNLFWNLFNLIPIIPLDGGMIMRECVSGAFPRHGPRLAYGISFLVAGLIAIYSLLRLWRPIPYPPLDPLFTALMFGWFAFNSFSAMQAEQAPQDSKRRWREYEERDW